MLNLFQHQVVAQVLAGHELTLYTDIIPDTLINGICHSSAYYETYSIDNSLEIKSFCSTSPGGTDEYTYITPLQPNVYIRSGRIDSVYNNFGAYWMIACVAKPLYYGDTINSSDAEWKSITQYLVKVYSASGSSQSITDWADTSDKYIGINYQTTTGNIYGWIRLNWSNGALVKDYSFETNQTGINILEANIFTLYPNPATTTLTIQSTPNSYRDNSPQTTVTIYNAQGQVVSYTLSRGECVSLSAGKGCVLDISPFPTGLYYLHLQSEEGTATKKFEIIK